MKSLAQAQELKFLALTLALVVFMGLGSVFNMVRAPAPLVASKTEANLLRVPASLPTAGASEKPVSALGKMETLDWSCGDAAKELQVSSNRIRVKGRVCSKDSLSILNETNGLTATVFQGEKGYSTEYMDLALGKNEILVNWQDKKGRPQTTKLIVIRQ